MNASTAIMLRRMNIPPCCPDRRRPNVWYECTEEKPHCKTRRRLLLLPTAKRQRRPTCRDQSFSTSLQASRTLRNVSQNLLISSLARRASERRQTRRNVSTKNVLLDRSSDNLGLFLRGTPEGS